jgi:DNA repair exonuclease SbcCD ATPase subunit
MKHVNFESLKIQNFFSIGETPVEINFSPGIHVITGNNKDRIDRKNGVGKSTIADAFYFAIFGKTIRDITKKELIANNLTDGVCAVYLSFNIISPEETASYKIVRQLKPSKLSLEKNGVDITLDSIANTTDYICKLIYANSEIFKNCVVMTANNTIPFMGQKTIMKRKFIENIFSLEMFGEMLKLARNDYNEIKKEYDLQITRLEEREQSLVNYIKQRDSVIQERREKIERYKTKLKENKNSIKVLREKINKIDSTSADPIKCKLVEINEGIAEIETRITAQVENCAGLKTDIKRDEEYYAKIGTDGDTCPTCLREIKDHDRDCIKKEKEQLKLEIESKKNNLSKCANTIHKLAGIKDKLLTLQQKNQSKLEQINIDLNSKQNFESNIAQYEEWIRSLLVDINQLKAKDTSVDSLISDAEKSIDELAHVVNKCREMISVIDYGKFIVSEEGVKAYIVKQILQLFNSRLAFYLKKMDANCICMFNEYFEEEIINENNKLCSYYNFSDGERKNIDLACLFTFADARRMQGNVAYNVSFFDELYDSSLDSKGVELVNKILNERVEQNRECIFVITHRPEAIKSISENTTTIYLQKENGITTRVHDVVS